MNPQHKKSIKLSPARWATEVKKAFDRDVWTCQVCRTPLREGLHPHHIIPKGRIRIDHVNNILTVCHECHRNIHDGNGLTVDDLIQKYQHRLKSFSW